MSASESDDETTEWTTKFPPTKIKALFADVLAQESVELITQASAVFVSDLVKASSTSGGVLTVEDIKKTVRDHEQFHFLEDVVKDMDETARKARPKKRKKDEESATDHAPGKPKRKTAADPDIQEIIPGVSIAAVAAPLPADQEIEADEEDYD